MKETEQKVTSWLDRMHSLLSWKIIFPDPNNPFGKTLSDKVLRELSENQDVLKKQLELHGSMDGEVIIKFKDLISLNVSTEHPIITKMNKKEFRDYLSGNGLVLMIESEVLNIQNAYKEELSRRAGAN